LLMTVRLLCFLGHRRS